MQREGHVGAALLAYAPFGTVIAGVGFVELATLGGVGMVLLATLPDYDLYVPFVEHRGVTHTVAFALLVGSTLGAGGVVVAVSANPTTAGVVGALGLFVGTLSVLAHVAADALTPMGVRPFWPVSGRRYSLELWRADNALANYLLLVLGAAAAAGGYHLVAVGG